MTRRLGFAVLCIGNDPINLNLRCSRLRDDGWDVISSVSGYDGLISLERESVDAVVLDLNGQGTENALIAGQIRKLKPHAPIIMLVKDIDSLAPGATDQADAVILKAEEDPTLHQRLSELLLRI